LLDLSAVLAHFILKERLPKLGTLGCVLCIVGSVVIVLHAPQEQSPTSVQQIWALATQPGSCLQAQKFTKFMFVFVIYTVLFTYTLLLASAFSLCDLHGGCIIHSAGFDFAL